MALLLSTVATLANSRASAIAQSGSVGGVPVGTYPIHDLGIHGEGEIVGVGGPGLDTGHCFFEVPPRGVLFEL